MNPLVLLATLLLAASCRSNPVSRASCTLSGSSISDLSSIKKSCMSITIDGLTVPAGETLDLTGLQSGTTVIFKGTIKFGYKEWSGPLISVAGSKITVTGSSGNKLDGDGAKYWDGKGGNGGKTKPKFFKVKLTDSSIKGLNIYNTPVHVFSINNCQNVSIQNVLIDNSNGDSNGGHNTDAFDVSESKQIEIKHNTVYNQDDCLAVNSVTDLLFQYNYCKGGHGISIGSVGGRSNNVVKTVQIKHNQVVSSTNGIRIKTVYGETGSVTDLLFQNTTLKDITEYGITVRGDYTNSGSKGTATSGCPIKDLTVKDVHGSVSSSATKIMILVSGASNWKFSDISISGGKSSSSCSGIPSGAGVSC